MNGASRPRALQHAVEVDEQRADVVEHGPATFADPAALRVSCRAGVPCALRSTYGQLELPKADGGTRTPDPIITSDGSRRQASPSRST